MRALVCVSLLVSLVLVQWSAAQSANSDPAYLALKGIGFDNEVATVSGLVLKRDAGRFTFRSGTFYFLAPVQGKVTGAVFIGDGSFSLAPPVASEQRSLALLAGGNEMVEEFSEAVLRFSDGTREEIEKASPPTVKAADPAAQSLLSAISYDLAHKVHYNFNGRLLQEVLSGHGAGLFAAFIRGKKFSDAMVYVVDPYGVGELHMGIAPEEVGLMTYSEAKWGVWAGFHLAGEYASGKATSDQDNELFHVSKQQLDTTIESNGELKGDALTTVVANADGARVLALHLYPSLRVSSVTTSSGQPLGFIQEDKKEDPQFFVILPADLAKGEEFTFRTRYAGKEAVSAEGNGNYYLNGSARDSWYPGTGFGRSFATYEMTFRVPKAFKVAATGTQLEDKEEGGMRVSRWKSEGGQSVAGFNMGKFKYQEAKLDKLGFVVQSYANEDLPSPWNMAGRTISDLPIDVNSTHQEAVAVGTMDTTRMIKRALAEGQLSVDLYTSYFGAIPFKRVALTQQTACTYGQSWPELVYLPICSFFDSTVRHEVLRTNSDVELERYFEEVAPHEVAHQWFGEAVGMQSYRDTWMSEGFAHFSTALFLQAFHTDKQAGDYMKFWEDQRRLLLERNNMGFRAIDLPLTLGPRSNNFRTGSIYNRLVYSKGAYVLHMIRRMMWSPQNGDQRFRDMMHDYVTTYSGRAASTEDFKAMVEKHITPEMDVNHDGKLDWFFNEFVYGTALPSYRMQASFEPGADGNVALKIHMEQSNVDDDFLMLVPIYLELANGKIVRLGMVPMAGNRTFEKTIPLGGVKETPRRAMLNYYDDVLCTTN